MLTEYVFWKNKILKGFGVKKSTSVILPWKKPMRL